MTVGGGSLTEEDLLTPAASAGFAMYRAVHPVFDLGARLGVVAPETSDEVASGGSLTCPADHDLTRSGDLRVRGATLDLTVGLRVRVFGARTPFHVTVGAGLGLRAVATSDGGRWTCTRFDPGTGQWLEAPARGEPRGFGVYPAFASQLGYEAHFGAREELGFGALVSLHDDGQTSSSVVFRVMYTPSSGPSLPDAARSRGTRGASRQRPDEASRSSTRASRGDRAQSSQSGDGFTASFEVSRWRVVRAGPSREHRAEVDGANARVVHGHAGG